MKRVNGYVLNVAVQFACMKVIVIVARNHMKNRCSHYEKIKTIEPDKATYIICLNS